MLITESKDGSLIFSWYEYPYTHRKKNCYFGGRQGYAAEDKRDIPRG